MNILNRTDRTGLVANVVAAVVTVIAVNAVIFLSGWFQTDTPAAQQSRLDPPGWLVGVVWVFLFAFLGAARWLVVRSGGERAGRQAGYIVLLLLFCLAYPFYTMGLKSVAIGLIGNVTTIIAAAWVASRVRTSSKAAAGLVLPVVAWVSFATVLTALMLHGS